MDYRFILVSSLSVLLLIGSMIDVSMGNAELRSLDVLKD